jgi:hypothetical protein
MFASKRQKKPKRAVKRESILPIETLQSKRILNYSKRCARDILTKVNAHSA